MIYCAGPSAFPEDRWQLLCLADRLEGDGYRAYIPFRDGLDALYPDPLADDPTRRQKLARAVFAFNVGRLVRECDAVLFSLNGRVPDEGGLIVTAIAAMTGIPVVLFKQDHRSAFHGFDNAMIIGLSRTFSAVTRPGQIIRAIAREIEQGSWNKNAAKLPPAVAAAVDLGLKLTEVLDGQLPLTDGGQAVIIRTILSVYDGSEWADIQSPAEQPENQQAPGKGDRGRDLVYCSGPLFCPGEVRAMTAIARALEDSGRDAYLPHRDGVEAFVMKNTDNYLANLVRPLVRFFHRLTFAVDVYFILKCQALVFNANGRVPDEGGVVEIGLAFAAGKPVLLYREGLQTTGPDMDPMIIGAMALATPAATVDRIPEQAGQINRHLYWPMDLTGETGRRSTHMQSIVRLGHGAWRIMRRIPFLKPETIF
ncbi:MAG: nucleoside 2-deoxyribosyltransferase [Thermodesulfobacteriota bacterium]